MQKVVDTVQSVALRCISGRVIDERVAIGKAARTGLPSGLVNPCGNKCDSDQFTKLSEQHMATMPMSASANPVPMAEAELIRLSLEGNSQAFSELVTPYRTMFYRKALSIVRNEADAEDVTQTALLKAFKKLSQFRLDSQFRTWVTSIVTNEALMCLRTSNRFKRESIDREEGEDGSSTFEIADPRENPSLVLERKQLRAAILKAASLLPSLLRSVFILRDLRLLSISDTARTLGITETCAKTRLRRARLQLQRTLAHFRGATPTVMEECEENRTTPSVPWSWSSMPPFEIEMEAIH